MRGRAASPVPLPPLLSSCHQLHAVVAFMLSFALPHHRCVCCARRNEEEEADRGGEEVICEERRMKKRGGAYPKEKKE